MHFGICKSAVEGFSWKLYRLTLKDDPAVYHWLWFNFSFDVAKG